MAGYLQVRKPRPWVPLEFSQEIGLCGYQSIDPLNWGVFVAAFRRNNRAFRSLDCLNMRVTHVLVHCEESVSVFFAVFDNLRVFHSLSTMRLFWKLLREKNYLESSRDEFIATIPAKPLLQEQNTFFTPLLVGQGSNASVIP
ncbi:MAG TPA: hypothetical protein VN822_14220 [Candidatus Acidoferrales bacterium]|nr:hypothetical protein [Candidatus Acidoferrales bacterium]